MNRLLVALLAALSFIFGGQKLVACKLPDGQILEMSKKDCKLAGGHAVKQPRPEPTSTPSVTPGPITPTTTPTEAPTPSATPTPTPVPPTISVFNVYDGTSGESTYGYVTGVRAGGSNIGFEARMTLRNSGTVYVGMYQGGDGNSWILTDFIGLPHCQNYDVIVTGDNGVGVASNAVSTVCP